MKLERVMELLEEKGYKSEVTNYDVERLVVFTDGECNPCFVVETLINDNKDKSDEEVVDWIISVVNKNKPDITGVMKVLKSSDEIKKNLILYLMPKYNPTVLSEPFLDMYKGVKIALDGMAIKLTDTLLDMAGITREEAFEIAEQRTREGIKVCNMTDMEFLLDGFDFKPIEELEINEDEEPIMLILTNDNQYNGASAIVFNDVLEQIREKLDSDYYIIPSSVHEVLIVRAYNANTNDINKMIEDVNETQVDPRDRLVNHFYIYSKEKGLHYIK